MLDPGIGFGKTRRAQPRCCWTASTASPRSAARSLLGASRKRFLGAILGAEPADRVMRHRGHHRDRLRCAGAHVVPRARRASPTSKRCGWRWPCARASPSLTGAPAGEARRPHHDARSLSIIARGHRAARALRRDRGGAARSARRCVVDVRLDPPARGAGQQRRPRATRSTTAQSWTSCAASVAERRVQPARAPRHRDRATASGHEFDPAAGRGRGAQDRAAGRRLPIHAARVDGGAHRVSAAAGSSSSGRRGAPPARRAARLRLARLQPRRPRGVRWRAARDALAALPATTVVAALPHLRDRAPGPARPAAVPQPGGLPRDGARSRSTCCASASASSATHGRVRELRFGPRTLDVDILLFQDVESDDPELTLPHPRMWRRAFVLVPLAELWDAARGACRTSTSPRLGAEPPKARPSRRSGEADTTTTEGVEPGLTPTHRSRRWRG